MQVYRAYRLSRNTSLQGFAFNTKPGGNKLLHELTCIPVSLDQFITQVNGSFELKVKELIPSSLSLAMHQSSFIIHDSMILKTSNAVGSGFEIYGSKISPGKSQPTQNRCITTATKEQHGTRPTWTPRCHMSNTKESYMRCYIARR